MRRVDPGRVARAPARHRELELVAKKAHLESRPIRATLGKLYDLETAKTISILQASKILSEITGKLRDRSFGYSKYLTILCTDTDPVRTTSTT